MGRNPVANPLQYATPQFKTGPPATYTTAQRLLKGYDYVIVGAGGGGCILASKLSEDPRTSVLLLEAGGDNTSVLQSKVPLMFPTLFHTEHDWDYSTCEQPGLASRKLYWPRGRMLGGSTSMNAMIYHHASKSDFDEWAVRHGCEGWSYDDLQPYFRAMERFTPNAARPVIDAKHRGDKGHWETGYSWLSEMGDKGFLPACEDAGIPPTADFNTPEGTLGATRLQTFIDPKGQRSSFATAYLTPEVRKRPNLTIACGAQVTRLLMDRLSNPTPAVIGVEFQTKRGGELFEVHARKEVILSGGAVNTPQILLLSGIGPDEELNKHGIPIVKANESVGKNLKDHVVPTPISCKAKSGTTMDYLGSPLRALPALARWMVLGSGPLTHNAGEAAAFIRSFEHQFPGRSTPNDNTSGKTGPDVEIVGAPMSFLHHGEEPPPAGVSVFTLGCCSLRPQSKGTITLQSKDAFEPPRIDPNYLSDEDNNDLKVLLTGLRVCLRIMRSPALSKYLEPVPSDDNPWSYWWPYSSSDIEQISDEDLTKWLKEKAFTLYHPVGTARMGASPESSVVDTQCRVHGVGRLRVLDASVFPEQISGHPTAAIGAMAYKLSEMMRGGGKGRVMANL